MGGDWAWETGTAWIVKPEPATLSDVYAVEDICSHDGQPLTDGPVQGTAIECPRHGARFDVRSGRPLCMPAVEPIATYEVKVEGNDILLRSR